MKTSVRMASGILLLLGVYLFPLANDNESGDNADEKTSRPITGTEAGLSIYVEDWRFASEGANLVLAIWADGYVVWSEDLALGGPPYRCGRIDRDVFSKFLTNVQSDGYFGDPILARPNIGADTKFKALVIETNNHRLSMQSLHEIHSPVRVRLDESTGFSNTKLGILSESNAADLYYRLAWAELQLNSLRILPDRSMPVNGGLVMRDRRLWWQPE